VHIVSIQGRWCFHAFANSCVRSGQAVGRDIDALESLGNDIFVEVEGRHGLSIYLQRNFFPCENHSHLEALLVLRVDSRLYGLLQNHLPVADCLQEEVVFQRGFSFGLVEHHLHEELSERVEPQVHHVEAKKLDNALGVCRLDQELISP